MYIYMFNERIIRSCMLPDGFSKSVDGFATMKGFCEDIIFQQSGYKPSKPSGWSVLAKVIISDNW